MILHIGWETCVNGEDIVCILRKDAAPANTVPVNAASAGAAHTGAAFLARARQEGKLFRCPEGERAYVVTEAGGETAVYASALSTATLHRRVQAGGLADAAPQ